MIIRLIGSKSGYSVVHEEVKQSVLNVINAGDSPAIVRCLHPAAYFILL